MLENFKSGSLVSGSSDIAKTEKSDCFVRAVANACDVQYDQAHKFVKLNFNRKKGEGTKSTILHFAKLKKMEFEPMGQLQLFPENLTRLVKCLGYAPKIGGSFTNPEYTHKPVAYTVKAFAQKYSKGNFILTVEGHALAIKNGIVVDNDNYQFNGYRRVVESAYQIN